MARKKTKHPMLRLEGPGYASRYVDLLRERYVIGRGDPAKPSSVDFEIPQDEHLSRQHCAVASSPKGYTVENLSPNGSLLNGRKVSGIKRLQHKDTIEIGAETTLEYCLYSDEERAKALHIATDDDGEEAEVDVDATKSKSFVQRPIFLVMLGFYALIAVMVFSVLGQKKKVVRDPGKGPYFKKMLDQKPETTLPKSGNAKEAAAAHWARARLAHGDELVGEGDHAFRLLVEARKVAGLLGYPSINRARDKGEVFAQLATIAQDELDKRVMALYVQGKEYIKARHWRLAQDCYQQIVDAVPDRKYLIRRYALQRISQLKRRR